MGILFNNDGRKEARRARREEAERQARIAGAQSQIRGIFNNPEQERLYKEYEDSAYGIQNDFIKRRAAREGRGLSATLAARGNLGGSAEALGRAIIVDDTVAAGLRARAHAKNSAAGLRREDQGTMQTLLRSAASSGRPGDYVHDAARALRATERNAVPAPATSLFTGLFNGLSAGIPRSEFNKGFNQGARSLSSLERR